MSNVTTVHLFDGRQLAKSPVLVTPSGTSTPLRRWDRIGRHSLSRFAGKAAVGLSPFTTTFEMLQDFGFVGLGKKVTN